jgi:hypothetical protein
MSGRSVVVLAESDSYISWAENLMLRAPESWDVTRLLVGFPTNPTPTQLGELTRNHGGSHWSTVDFADVPGRLGRIHVDIVILACTGPLVAMLTKQLRRHHPSAKLVNAIPGVALPSTRRAVERRRGVDVFIAHSRRERREFGVAFGPSVTVALATLPEFCDRMRVPIEPLRVRQVLFAEQAIIPEAKEDRERLVELLAGLPVDEVVIKQRVRDGDPSTHTNGLPLAAIVRDRESAGVANTPRIRCVAGPLDVALSRCDGVLTVCSTAALTALSAGIPAGFVTDFGVGGALRNDVFAGSSMLVGLAGQRSELVLAPPDPAWMADNYFHGREHDDWVDIVEHSTGSVRSARRGAVEPVTEMKTRLKATRQVRARMRTGAGDPLATRGRGGALALIESPFQLLSLIEAIVAGVVEPPSQVIVPKPMQPDLVDLARAAGVEIGSWTVETSLAAVLRRAGHASHVVVGDVFSGRSQLVIARQPGVRTTLLDDGASSLHVAAALRDEVRLVRPRVALGSRRLALGLVARTSLRRTANEGRLGMFTAFVDRPQRLIGATVSENGFAWTRRVALPDQLQTRRRVVFGSAMSEDGLISTASYRHWLARSVVAGETSFVPHRRETEAMCGFVRDLGALVGPRGGLPAELTMRDAPDMTEFRTLPSTVALTLPLIRNRCVLVCDPVQAHWWTPAAPPPVRSLLASVARRAADRTEVPAPAWTCAS